MMGFHDCKERALNVSTQNPEVTIKKVVEACFAVAGKKLKIEVRTVPLGSPVRGSLI